MTYSSEIPLKAQPRQSISIVLGDQPCVISLRSLGGNMLLTLSLNGAIICENTLITNRAPIIKAAYTGFVGELVMIDTQGDEPPEYDGLGTRWRLLYNPDI